MRGPAVSRLPSERPPGGLRLVTNQPASPLDLEGVVTYDEGLADAAHLIGIAVVAPVYPLAG